MHAPDAIKTFLEALRPDHTRNKNYISVQTNIVMFILSSCAFCKCILTGCQCFDIYQTTKQYYYSVSILVIVVVDSYSLENLFLVPSHIAHIINFIVIVLGVNGPLVYFSS